MAVMAAGNPRREVNEPLNLDLYLLVDKILAGPGTPETDLYEWIEAVIESRSSEDELNGS